MATATTPNSRASLLAGLRTGGVRSTSQPHQVPHTAALTGSFSAPRFASTSHPSIPFPEEDEDDELADMAAHSLSFNGTSFNGRQGIPMTAAADGSAHNFQQQQQQLIMRQLAAQRAAVGAGMSYPGNADQTEMQAQMMQMEMLKYQAFHQAQQAQQYQAELIAQAQRQQQQQQQQQQPTRGSLRRTSMEPITAGPTVTTFDHRANVAAQLRARAQQAEHRSALAAGDDLGPVPMTAAIGGKFASRMLNPHANSFITSRFGDQEDESGMFVPLNSTAGPATPTPSRTTVISGGTSLGTPTATTFNIPAPSKSDAAVSWRRGSATTNNSVLRSASATPPLNTKVNRGSPSMEEMSPTAKTRPQPLRFNAVVSSPLPTVSIDTSTADEDGSSGSSKGSPTSASTPSTPPSAHSSLSGEVKKQYEGVGMGRPAIATNPIMRHASLPSRQPKGPPSGADELGPRNFATRLRRKAIGGLGSLVTAREGGVAIEIQAY